MRAVPFAIQVIKLFLGDGCSLIYLQAGANDGFVRFVVQMSDSSHNVPPSEFPSFPYVSQHVLISRAVFIKVSVASSSWSHLPRITAVIFGACFDSTKHVGMMSTLQLSPASPQVQLWHLPFFLWHALEGQYHLFAAHPHANQSRTFETLRALVHDVHVGCDIDNPI